MLYERDRKGEIYIFVMDLMQLFEAKKWIEMKKILINGLNLKIGKKIQTDVAMKDYKGLLFAL